jgi:GNAT superfamily N-acetyltransferase
MKDLYVRNAHEDERRAIREITLAAYEQYANKMPSGQWEYYRQNILETLAKAGLNESIVAVQDKIVVGSVLLYPAEANVYTDMLDDTHWPEIRLLATKPDARGQGIGRALMAECVQRARSTGSTRLGLHTTDMMQVAQRMYIGMGFVHTPALDFHPSEDVLVKGYLLHL